MDRLAGSGVKKDVAKLACEQFDRPDSSGVKLRDLAELVREPDLLNPKK